MIQATKLSYQYNSTAPLTLNQVNFHIQSGECVVLCGKSGCGKTTLLLLLNQLLPQLVEEGQLQGELTFQHKPWQDFSTFERVKLIGSVFQNPRTQFFSDRVRDELTLVCENLGMSSDKTQQQITKIACLFGIEDLLDTSMYHLSGGQKQLVACAAAYIHEPAIFILDEPSSHLDQETILKLADILRHIKQLGTTLIIAEHRLYYLLQLADRYFYLEEGNLQVLTKPELIALPTQQRKTMGLRALQFEPEPLPKFQHSEKLQQLVMAPACFAYKRKDPVLSIEHLSLSNQQVNILAGKNGAGKTTLVHLLCGFLPQKKAKLLLNGQTIRKKTTLSWLVPQEVTYQFTAHTVLAELLSISTDQNELKEMIQCLNLKPVLNHNPFNLSGGEKQRLALALALLSQRSFLILDEPTSGLDYYHLTQVAKAIQLAAKKGKLLLIITHDLELIQLVGERLLYLEHGKIIQDSPLINSSISHLFLHDEKKP